MSAMTKLTGGGQITLPKAIRTKTNMQPGDFVEVDLDNEGHIVLTPKKLVNASQAYFWSEEWQKGEARADEDIKSGRVKKFSSVKDAAAYLESKG
ncbi:MAG: AbrB/MazE/SpoVT family DNA-binding domain-containing protein [Dehalococcoidia bacterium]|jgi:bifunctional DNA-binding transcriptional regulator/antitoxin component of YhaV-PrlF toxin-antitoxin module